MLLLNITQLITRTEIRAGEKNDVLKKQSFFKRTSLLFSPARTLSFISCVQCY